MTQMPEGKRWAQTVTSILLTLGRQLASSFANLITIALIAQAISAAGAGRFAVALLLPSLMTQILNLGLAPANVYFVASGRSSVSSAWVASRNLSFLLVCVGTAFGLCVLLMAADTLLPGVGRGALLIALAIFPFMLINLVLLSLLQARQDFIGYNQVFLVQPVLSLAMVVALAVVDALTLEAALLATFMGHAAATFTGLWVVRCIVPLTADTVGGTEGGWTAYLGPAIRYGIKIHLSDNVAFLNRRLDLFLVNLFAGIEASGLYVIAVRLVEQLWVLSKAVAMVLFPKLTSFAPDDPASTALTEMASRIVLWLSVLAAGALAALSAPLLTNIFGDEFLAAQIAVLILLPGVVARSLSRILSNDFAARGLAGLNLMLGILVLILNTALNFALVPHYGISGAATATTCAYLSMALLRLVLQRRITGLTIWRATVPLPGDLLLVIHTLKRRYRR